MNQHFHQANAVGRSRLALIILIIAWQVQVNVVEELIFSKGSRIMLILGYPLFILRADRNDIVLFNGEQPRLKQAAFHPL